MPCIFMAPGGASVINGATLDDDESELFEAYAKEGFVVVAYSLDGGEVENENADAVRDPVRAIKTFQASRGGIANAQRAMEYVLHNVPEADPQRLYAAGGSAAGSVALCLAAADPRISAVYATAPVTNPGATAQGEGELRKMEASIPDIREFVRQVSPSSHVREMHCPVFVYQPGLDLFGTQASVEAYCKELTAAGVTVTYRLGASDFEAMQKEERYPGLAWLKSLKGPAAPAAPAPAN
jgi:dienelactone hydrolase